MEWVTSTTEPNKIEYQPMSSGKAFVMLRKDIKKTMQTFDMGGESHSQEVYIYHEVQFFTTLTREEVETRFDELYLTADAPKPTMAEVVNNLSDVVDDLMVRVDELENGGNE